MHQEVVNQNEALKTQIKTFSQKIEELSRQQKSSEAVIARNTEQLQAYEAKVEELTAQRDKAKNKLSNLQEDLADFKKSNESFERENKILAEAATSN